MQRMQPGSQEEEAMVTSSSSSMRNEADGDGSVLALAMRISREARALCGSTVDVVDVHDACVGFGTRAFERVFLRDYVAGGRPLLMRNACASWPAVDEWRDDANIVARMGDARVRVNWTPDGRADSIQYVDEQAYFVEPVETQMAFGDAVRCLGMNANRHAGRFVPHAVPDGWVPYISAQNDSMHADFAPLVRDIDVASSAMFDALFGAEPEAVNFWAGDARSLTSFHKDHYENVYFVLRGCKHVRLLPPTEGWRLRFVDGLHGRYVLDGESSGQCEGLRRKHVQQQSRIDVSDPPQKTRWSAVGAVSPDGSTIDVLDDTACGAPLHVTLSAGDGLYIPSMWYHEVCAGGDSNRTRDHSMSGGEMSIAVNRWYDMAYGERFAILNALGQM